VSKAVRPNEFAELEILHELRWYEAESPGLGERLWQDIQRMVELIGDHPAIGQLVRRTRTRGIVRRFPLEHFPFVLIYREHEEHIEIVALAPSSRKPNYWISRLRR